MFQKVPICLRLPRQSNPRRLGGKVQARRTFHPRFKSPDCRVWMSGPLFFPFSPTTVTSPRLPPSTFPFLCRKQGLLCFLYNEVLIWLPSSSLSLFPSFAPAYLCYAINRCTTWPVLQL